MTSALLQQWIQHPEMLDRDTLYELRTLVTRYPYFQSLRLLYLKNLYLLHDISFGAELRKAVLYVADRRVLFTLIEGDRYTLQPQQPSLLSSKVMEEEPSVDRTLSLIDAFLATVPEEHSRSVELDYAMDYTSFLMQDVLDEQPGGGAEQESSVPKLRGHELIDGFLQQRQLAGGHLPEVLEQKNEAEPERLEETTESGTEEVLDAEAREQVQPEVEEKTEEAEEEAEEEEETSGIASNEELDDSCFTETLAKIYVKQHRYDKALEIIKKLSLNYPKKNAYFADQIRFLEKLIINAKSK